MAEPEKQREPRRIAVVSSGRADYGHLIWPLRCIAEQPGLKAELIVMGAHLAPAYGHTDVHIAEDGFPISASLECLLNSDSDVGMAKSLGLATLSLADCLADMRPDALLLIADRYEMLAPASVATTLRIPIAHIEGGEVSQGAIDDPIRNALSKLAHLHFTPTATASQRLIAMGEEAWRVHQVGAPSLDHLRRSTLPDAETLQQTLGVRFTKPLIVVAYHPVTLQRDPAAESRALFEALPQIDGQIVFCFPNADAGAHQIMQRPRAFCDQRDDAHLFVNLAHLDYWGLLRSADLILGNSSSGIMEAPAIALPCVNIGERQAGRERSPNIIDCEASAPAILAAVGQALEPTFKTSLAGMQCAYGDGHAGERIAEVLANTRFDQQLLRKAPVPVADAVVSAAPAADGPA